MTTEWLQVKFGSKTSEATVVAIWAVYYVVVRTRDSRYYYLGLGCALRPRLLELAAATHAVEINLVITSVRPGDARYCVVADRNIPP